VGSAVADSAAVDLVGADSEVAADVNVKEWSVAKQDEIQIWRMTYVVLDSYRKVGSQPVRNVRGPFRAHFFNGLM
jgi:hypothetical protein